MLKTYMSIFIYVLFALFIYNCFSMQKEEGTFGLVLGIVGLVMFSILGFWALIPIGITAYFLFRKSTAA